MRVPPSQPGYDLSIADLGSAEMGNLAIGHTIATGIQQMQQNGGEPDPLMLLAQMLKKQSVSATKYRIMPFSLATGRIQQILPENPFRKALLIVPDPALEIAVYLSEGPTDVDVPFDGPNDVRLKSSFKLVLDTTFPQPFQFFVAPTNPITLITAYDMPVTGVIIEGV